MELFPDLLRDAGISWPLVPLASDNPAPLDLAERCIAHLRSADLRCSTSATVRETPQVSDTASRTVYAQLLRRIPSCRSVQLDFYLLVEARVVLAQNSDDLRLAEFLGYRFPFRQHLPQHGAR